METLEALAELGQLQRGMLSRSPIARGFSINNLPQNQHIAAQQMARMGIFKDAGSWNYFWTPLGLALRAHLLAQKDHTPS